MTTLTGLCPDCDAQAQIIEQAPGVYVLGIAHDDTCPTYRAMTGDRS